MVDLPPPPVPIDADLLPDMPLKVGRLLRPVAREARNSPSKIHIFDSGTR